MNVDRRKQQKLQFKQFLQKSLLLSQQKHHKQHKVKTMHCTPWSVLNQKGCREHEDVCLCVCLELMLRADHPVSQTFWSFSWDIFTAVSLSSKQTLFLSPFFPCCTKPLFQFPLDQMHFKFHNLRIYKKLPRKQTSPGCTHPSPYDSWDRLYPPTPMTLSAG